LNQFANRLVLATLTRGTLRFYNSNVLFGRESEDSYLPIQQGLLFSILLHIIIIIIIRSFSVMIEKPDGHALDVSVGGDLLLLLGHHDFSV
jgi:hypothetical protein